MAIQQRPRLAVQASKNLGAVVVDMKPVVVRTSKARRAYKQKGMTKATHTSIVMTIPRDILDATGIQDGHTLVVSGYADGSFKVERAGDLMSADDEGL